MNVLSLSEHTDIKKLNIINNENMKNREEQNACK